MTRIPDTEASPVLRTDYSDDGAWEQLCTAIQRPAMFRANVAFVSDPTYRGFSAAQIVDAVPAAFRHSFLFVVDETAIRHPEHPLLVIDLGDEPGRTFRVIPSEMCVFARTLARTECVRTSSTTASAAGFIASNPILLDSKIMLTHYSAEVLFSPEARARFVEPNLESIPRHDD